MCGIVGYIGKKPCANLLYDGLKRLEYRGYDSAGIAVLAGGAINFIKSQGKLKELQPLMAQLPATATVGMGHTRWATHGPPTTKNAHPHISEHVAVVHNGIIENYRELKDELTKLGAKFQSDTDTEVVLHLLDIERKKSKTAKEAILNTLKRLQGAFSLGILFAAEPDAIYVVKQGSPLVIGVGDGENVFGSDATALVELTKAAIFLNDGECGKITATSIDLWDFSGKEIRHRPTQLNWSSASLEKRGYRHYMLKEIHEQPSVVANTIARLLDRVTLQFNEAEMGLDKIDLGKVQSISIVACGSAHYAGAVAKYFMEPMLGIPVHVELASEFRYRKPFINDKTLFIAVSQSGETADTLASVKHAKSQGCQTLSVCNVHYASIPRECHATLYMEAGPEIGVCSTKCFTSQILCLYLLSFAAGVKLRRLPADAIKQHLEELGTLPLQMDRVINTAEHVEEVASRYYERPNFLFVGRGLSYPIALEGALKLKEISYVHAEAYAAGELKHGPIALVDRHMPIVAVAPRDAYYEKTFSNIEEVRAREGVVIALGEEHDQNLRDLSADYLSVPRVINDTCQAILNLIPLQLLAYYIAVKRGTDVDQPRNLAKSVTVE